MLNCDKSILVCKVGIGDLPKYKAMEIVVQCKLQIEKAFQMDQNPDDNSLVLLVVPDRGSNSFDFELLNPRHPDIEEIKSILADAKEEIENLYK